MSLGRVDPDVEGLLSRLLDGQQQALGADLLGTYVFGSVVTGDFEPGISDVDVVAVLRADPTASQLEVLSALHREIVQDMPRWDDRIEVVYLSGRALRTFRTQRSAAARISPGEPFHAIEVDERWLIDWYRLRLVGEPLFGPAVTTLVPTISRGEYVDAVRRHLIGMPGSADGLSSGSQAFVILTMCRGLRTVRTGEHVSKREAARWGCEVMPEHASLIRDAVTWRESSRTTPRVDGQGTRVDTERFVADIKRRLVETDPDL